KQLLTPLEIRAILLRQSISFKQLALNKHRVTPNFLFDKKKVQYLSSHCKERVERRKVAQFDSNPRLDPIASSARGSDDFRMSGDATSSCGRCIVTIGSPSLAPEGRGIKNNPEEQTFCSAICQDVSCEQCLVRPLAFPVRPGAMQTLGSCSNGVPDASHVDIRDKLEATYLTMVHLKHIERQYSHENMKMYFLGTKDNSVDDSDVQMETIELLRQ
ncbi:hypothetical protein C0J52_24083, partial [Blattella germanica]